MMTFYELNLLGEYDSDPIEILFLPILVFVSPPNSSLLQLNLLILKRQFLSALRIQIQCVSY